MSNGNNKNSNEEKPDSHTNKPNADTGRKPIPRKRSNPSEPHKSVNPTGRQKELEQPKGKELERRAPAKTPAEHSKPTSTDTAPHSDSNSPQGGTGNGKEQETSNSGEQQQQRKPRNPKMPKAIARGAVIGAGALAGGGAVLGAGSLTAGKELAKNAFQKSKDDLTGNSDFSEEAPKPKNNSLLTKAAKKAGSAIKAKAAVGMKALLLNPKGVIITTIAVLIPVVLTLAYIVSDTADRAVNHTKKYGCVQDKFTMDFLNLLAPGQSQTIADQIGDLFSNTDSSCMEGAGFTGEFYPPTVGNVTQTWYYTSGDFHGATDIANGKEGPEEAPVFAYAGGEVTMLVYGTANAVGNPSSCSAWAPWSYAQTVQGDLIITHQPGLFSTRYTHMWKQHTIAKLGDIVSAGDLLGGQGNSGYSCGTHLHFEVHESGQPVDPIPHMKERGIEFPYTISSLPDKPEPGEGVTAGTGDPNTVGAVNSSYMSYAVKAMNDAGINASITEQTCLAKLWNRESNWRHTATNPNSGAYGIPQSLPGDKMASEGADWRTNPQTQIRWGVKYIKSRYQTPCGAWAHSEKYNWY